MYEQAVIYTKIRILLSRTKKYRTDTHTYMNFRLILLSERYLTEKGAVWFHLYLIFKNAKRSDRQQISGYQCLRWKQELIVKGHDWILKGDWILISCFWWFCILLCVSYASIKFVEKRNLQMSILNLYTCNNLKTMLKKTMQ